jgi:subtilisin family serine protease
LKKHIVALALLICATLALPYAAAAREAGPVDESPARILSRQAAGQPASVIVILKNQADPRTAGGRTRRQRKQNVVRLLRQHADATQAGLRALLQQRRVEGKVTVFTPLWIQNALAVTADSSVIDELARSPLVARILADTTIPAPPRASQPLSESASVEPNLSAINAPALWDLGYYGQGVVVANMDTGVDNTHPDLAAQWRGGTNSWYDPYGQHATPFDLNGHGTWRRHGGRRRA